MVQSLERTGAKRKRLILGLLWIAFFVAYLDRTNIAVAGPTMMKAFGMTTQQFGYVLAAFTAGYALTQIPGGLLADRYGAKRFLIIALLVWSLFTGLTAITASFVALIVVRFCFGVGEGLEQGAQFRAIGDTFTSSERSEASGMFLTALALGPAFVAPLAAFIIARAGWQPLFLWLTLPGLIVAALVWRYFPATTSGGSGDEAPAASADASWGALVGDWRAWCAFATYLLFNVAFWGLLNWLPSYLSAERHIDIKTLGWLASVPYLCGFFGLLVMGRLAKTSLYRSRPVLLAVTYLLAAIGLDVAYTAGTATVSVIGLSFGAFFLYGSFGPFWGIALDLVPASMRGTMSGFANFGGQIGGFFSPIVVGAIVQNTKSYSGGFVFMIGALVLACITMIALQRTQTLPGTLAV
jgi:sugar phosphate permease